jgi:hypothetical protein
MTMNSYENHPERDAINDMLTDLELDAASEAQLRTALTDVRAQATKVPTASADVAALLQGATPLRRGHRRLMVAAAAGALALGGASAAAAANQLPDSIQEVVANATEDLPVSAPHPKPVKPTNAPSDAPGQLKDKTHDGDDADESTHDNSDAPGQIQKATKPDPSDPGPAKPADPGSHGRARAAAAQADHDHTDQGKHGKDGTKADKPAKTHDDDDADDADDVTDGLDDPTGSGAGHGRGHHKG